MSDWQPMITAPRDGSAVELWDIHFANPVEAYWIGSNALNLSWKNVNTGDVCKECCFSHWRNIIPNVLPIGSNVKCNNFRGQFITHKIDEADAAREYILSLVGYQYKDYVANKLAGDFAADLVKAIHSHFNITATPITDTMEAF